MSGETDNEGHTAHDLDRALRLEWPFWLAAVVGLVVTGYFYTAERLFVDYTAESFYAVLFGMLTIGVVAYGVARTRNRMQKYDF